MKNIFCKTRCISWIWQATFLFVNGLWWNCSKTTVSMSLECVQSFIKIGILVFEKWPKSQNLRLYRPKQPNWEYTIWKFQDFSPIHILCEIHFSHFKAPKTAILSSFEFQIFGNFWNFQVWNVSKNQKSKPPKRAKFHKNQISELLNVLKRSILIF